MAINSYDIVSTLQALGMMKYWKGKHIILKKQVRINIHWLICSKSNSNSSTSYSKQCSTSIRYRTAKVIKTTTTTTNRRTTSRCTANTLTDEMERIREWTVCEQIAFGGHVPLPRNIKPIEMPSYARRTNQISSITLTTL